MSTENENTNTPLSTPTPAPLLVVESTAPNTPRWKLRRLASRVLRVHARNRNLEPGLAAFDESITRSAPEYAAAFDELRRLLASHGEELDEGKAAIAALVHKLRIWAPIVARDVDRISASDFGDNPEVPDDVINDARSLIEHVTGRTDDGKPPLSYADALVADLGAVLAAAEKEWGEADDYQWGLGTARKKVRETGARFERDLIAYRRVLRQVIGREATDYQKLRAERARTPDADDDAVAASLPSGSSDPEDAELELPPEEATG